jgi:hypothetical protein
MICRGILVLFAVQSSGMDSHIHVAVWVRSFQAAETPVMVRDGNLLRMCNRTATICAASADRAFRMKVTTGPLAPDLLERLERLQSHGFTIVEIPGFWAYESSRPILWRDNLTKQAIERVMNLPVQSNPEQPAPYDEELAHEVLVSLDKNYPHVVNIIVGLTQGPF